MANKRDFESPAYQKNLVYAKAIEIRDSLLANQQELLSTLSKAESDVVNERVASIQSTFDDIKTT